MKAKIDTNPTIESIRTLLHQEDKTFEEIGASLFSAPALVKEIRAAASKGMLSDCEAYELMRRIQVITIEMTTIFYICTKARDRYNELSDL